MSEYKHSKHRTPAKPVFTNKQIFDLSGSEIVNKKRKKERFTDNDDTWSFTQIILTLSSTKGHSTSQQNNSRKYRRRHRHVNSVTEAEKERNGSGLCSGLKSNKSRNRVTYLAELLSVLCAAEGLTLAAFKLWGSTADLALIGRSGLIKSVMISEAAGRIHNSRPWIQTPWVPTNSWKHINTHLCQTDSWPHTLLSKWVSWTPRCHHRLSLSNRYHMDTRSHEGAEVK